MGTQNWKIGDWVIYRKSKRSTSPGPRAQGILPAKSGDSYNYTVDKYWVVTSIQNDGRLVVTTLRGKQHVLTTDDAALRKPFFWERLLHRRRFQDVERSIG